MNVCTAVEKWRECEWFLAFKVEAIEYLIESREGVKLCHYFESHTAAPVPLLYTSWNLKFEPEWCWLCIMRPLLLYCIVIIMLSRYITIAISWFYEQHNRETWNLSWETRSRPDVEVEGIRDKNASFKPTITISLVVGIIYNVCPLLTRERALLHIIIHFYWMNKPPIIRSSRSSIKQKDISLCAICRMLLVFGLVSLVSCWWCNDVSAPWLRFSCNDICYLMYTT